MNWLENCLFSDLYQTGYWTLNILHHISGKFDTNLEKAIVEIDVLVLQSTVRKCRRWCRMLVTVDPTLTFKKKKFTNCYKTMDNLNKKIKTYECFPEKYIGKFQEIAGKIEGWGFLFSVIERNDSICDTNPSKSWTCIRILRKCARDFALDFFSVSNCFEIKSEFNAMSSALSVIVL